MQIGILGNGQLGEMLASAAFRFGHRVRTFGNRKNVANRSIADGVLGDWSDEAALARFCEGTDVVTCEMEQIPAKALEFVAAHAELRPGLSAMLTAQDRVREKQLFDDAGVPCAPWAAIGGESDLEIAATAVGFPAILKTSRGGYDGKGQARVRSLKELRQAWQAVGVECVLEGMLELRREVSLIAARGIDGKVAFFPPSENQHRAGILRLSRVPADVDTKALNELHVEVSRLLEGLEYIGVMTLELFETSQGWVANEIAPRVHNSGHWSIEGAFTSQFDQHIRAITGMSLGNASARGECAMLNIIGEYPDADALARVSGAFTYLYGKDERPGRKLGHITFCQPTRVALDDRVAVLESLGVLSDQAHQAPQLDSFERVDD